MEELLQTLMAQPYFNSLNRFLDSEYTKRTVFPARSDIFKSFSYFNENQLKVVIIGQDPYFNRGQAMGLSFSVPEGQPLPPSLRNIIKEISQEYCVTPWATGDLSYLARQGVFLLNSILTVVANKPLSHDIVEYKMMMEDILVYLNKLEQPIVFLLWGEKAGKYARFLSNPLHLVLKSKHPSPLSANRGGWFGNNHFRTANDFLFAAGETQINWLNTDK